jgi:hypothetical protein
MRSGIREAQERFERDVLPSVNDYQANKFREYLTSLESKATAEADAYTAARETEIRALRDGALRELTAIRDEADDLRATEDRDAREIGLALRDLDRRRHKADADLAKADLILTRVEEVEADPVAFVDDLKRRTNQLPEWPF